MIKNSNIFEYNIKIGLVQRNGLHLMCARLDMDFSQVVTLAVDDYLRNKLTKGEYNSLDDIDYTNHLIGETINGNRGVWGYDAEMNPIPMDKRHLLLKHQNIKELE